MKTIMNLIVFEKDSETIELIRNTLKEEHVKISNVSNWEQTEEISHKEKIDLIIFNYELNSSTKSTNYNKLRSDKIYSHTPVIFLSTEPDDLDELLSFEHPQDDFILKPIKPTLLKAKVRSYKSRLKNIVDEYEDQIEKLKDNIKFFFPHEFRTALSTILGYSEIIKQTTESAKDISESKILEIFEMSSTVLNAGKYLQRISENLILYSQLQLMKSEKISNTEFTNSSLNNSLEIINDAVFALTSENNRKNDLALTLNPLYIQINGYFFYKIIYELIDNAIKFSDIGTKILIKTFKEDNKFVFQISDHGRGMMPKEIKSIGAFRQFERNIFEQQGVGLGLSLAKLLTEMNNGTFTINSKKSLGTNITISLPLINNFL